MSGIELMAVPNFYFVAFMTGVFGFLFLGLLIRYHRNAPAVKGIDVAFAGIVSAWGLALTVHSLL